MKDKSLKVIYHRGEEGELFVFLYRSNLRIATIEVDAQNRVNVIRGRNNKSQVRLRELPTP